MTESFDLSSRSPSVLQNPVTSSPDPESLLGTPISTFKSPTFTNKNNEKPSTPKAVKNQEYSSIVSRILEKVAKSGGERQDNDDQNEAGVGENNEKVEKMTDQNREMDRGGNTADVKDVSSAPPPVNEMDSSSVQNGEGKKGDVEIENPRRGRRSKREAALLADLKTKASTWGEKRWHNVDNLYDGYKFPPPVASSTPLPPTSFDASAVTPLATRSSSKKSGKNSKRDVTPNIPDFGDCNLDMSDLSGGPSPQPTATPTSINSDFTTGQISDHPTSSTTGRDSVDGSFSPHPTSQFPGPGTSTSASTESENGVKDFFAKIQANFGNLGANSPPNLGVPLSMPSTVPQFPMTPDSALNHPSQTSTNEPIDEQILSAAEHALAAAATANLFFAIYPRALPQLLTSGRLSPTSPFYPMIASLLFGSVQNAPNPASFIFPVSIPALSQAQSPTQARTLMPDQTQIPNQRPSTYPVSIQNQATVVQTAALLPSGQTPKTKRTYNTRRKSDLVTEAMVSADASRTPGEIPVIIDPNLLGENQYEVLTKRPKLEPLDPDSLSPSQVGLSHFDLQSGDLNSSAGTADHNPMTVGEFLKSKMIRKRGRRSKADALKPTL
ncbi:hypothetical protein WR25_19491 isoform B [Diploscapter pachys]|nr:hypothetical protein WR25_19491 isoform B [Diploscapter pachys]